MQSTAKKAALPAMTLAALGVVFGDIGTSPLYALKESFHAAHGLGITPANVLGILSIIFWTMTMVITIKYSAIVMRADNNGEGGIMALLALNLRNTNFTSHFSIALVDCSSKLFPNSKSFTYQMRNQMTQLQLNDSYFY